MKLTVLSDRQGKTDFVRKWKRQIPKHKQIPQTYPK